MFKFLNFFKRTKDVPTNRAFIQDLFQISIRDYGLYDRALTHRSHISEQDNERLELLGDAVLDLVVADYIFHMYPEMDEGSLTKLKSKYISRENLIEIAQKDQLIEGLDLHKQKDLKNDLIIGNVLEALFGAMYIDQGFAITKKKAIEMFERTCDREKLLGNIHDPKSQFLEWAQKERREVRFSIESKGRDKFNAKLYLDGECIASGTGKSKKKSEKDAARQALGTLDITGPN